MEEKRLSQSIKCLLKQIISTVQKQTCRIRKHQSISLNQPITHLHLGKQTTTLRPILHVPTSRKHFTNSSYSPLSPLSLYPLTHPISEHLLNQTMYAQHFLLGIALHQRVFAQNGY